MSPDGRPPSAAAPDIGPAGDLGASRAPGDRSDLIEADGADERAIPLVIDLDETLTRVDTLHESAIGLLALGAPDLLACMRAAFHGKAAVKAAVADRTLPDASRLPYREEVLELIRAARAEGRAVHLVTAADQRIADAVSGHLGLFDGAHGSDGRTNLGGETKARFLVERFGARGFDYAGDQRKDLAVWAHARRAITVGVSPELARDASEASGRPEEAIAIELGAKRGVRPYIRALRPHQWLKNLLLFLPVLAAHQITPGDLAAVLWAFLAFSLTASSVYCINDLLDLDADRAHPRKRFRPFASGQIPALQGLVMAAVLFLTGFLLASQINAMTFGVLSVYFGATLLYSLALKRELVIDICLLAGLYTLRVIAGAMAASLAVSPWMLALSVFLFLALAAMKRQTELVDLAAAGKTETSGRAYRAEDLNVVTMMAIAAGYTAVLVLALYIYSPAVQQLYVSPLLLWGAPPILLYWISRMVMIAHRGGMNDDPVLFAVKDPISIACGAGIFGVGLLAKIV